MSLEPRLGWRVWLRVNTRRIGVACGTSAAALVCVAGGALLYSQAVPTPIESTAAASAETRAAPAPRSSAGARSDAVASLLASPQPTIDDGSTADRTPRVAATPSPLEPTTSDAENDQRVPAVVTVTTTAAPVPAAPPVERSARILDLETSCARALYGVADAYDAVTLTIQYGESVHQGHALGTTIVELQEVADTTADLGLAALLPSVIDDISDIRSQLLNSVAGSSISVDQLSADTDRFSLYCSQQLDPLS